MKHAICSFLIVLLGCGDDDGGGPRDAGALDGGPRRDAEGADDATSDPDAGTPAGRIGEIVAALETADATAADAILHDVAWAEGWPVEEGERWLFATRWDEPPGAVSLVGDINAWDTARNVATTGASGQHHWVVIERAAFDVAPAGAKYKWFAGEVYRLPPEATYYGFDEFGEHGWVRPPGAAPHLERYPLLRSMHLAMPRTIRAWLPAATAPAGARTLVLHDGQNVFGADGPFGGWHVDEALAARGASDVVAIAIDNTADRFEAYTHVSDLIGDPGGPRAGGLADDYVAMIRDEVLPWARTRWGIAASPETTMFMGSSLGGLVSLYIALQYPDLARCVAGMSPTLGWGAFDPAASGADALVRRWSTHGPVAVYLDSGGGSAGCTDPDGDGVQEDAADSDNYCTTTQLRDRLAMLGYVFGTDLTHWHEPGAEHNEAAWRARVPRALDACEASGW